MERKWDRETAETHIRQTLSDMREGRNYAVQKITEMEGNAEWIKSYVFMHEIADELSAIIIKILDKKTGYDLSDKTVSFLFATIKGITTGKILEEIKGVVDIADKQQERIKAGLVVH